MSRNVIADAGRAFDGAMIGAIAWLLGGLYADGWAHNNGPVPATDPTR